MHKDLDLLRVSKLSTDCTKWQETPREPSLFKELGEITNLVLQTKLHLPILVMLSG